MIGIVTGASRGIGRAIAEAFALEAGSEARLVISGTSLAHLEATASAVKAHGAQCVCVAGDVTQEATIRELVDTAVEQFGGITVLVNNAGMIDRSSTANLTSSQWDRLMDVNLGSVFRLSRSVLEVMVAQQQGVIVNVASSAAKKAHPNACAAYGVSKAGLVSLTQHLALEYAPHGIRVNAVCPGPIATDMTAQWTPEYRARKIASIPLGYLGEPEDIAKTVLFLASNGARFITGESINVNGGTFMD